MFGATALGETRRNPRQIAGRVAAIVVAGGVGIGSAAAGDDLPPPRPKPGSAALTALVEASVSGGAIEAPDEVAEPVAHSATRSIPPRADGPLPKPEGISPVRYLSPAQFATAKRALDAAFDDDFDKALALAAKTSDPLVSTLVDWLSMRSPSGDADARRIAGFFTDHPGWPEPNVLRARAEASLYDEPPPPAETITYFNRFPPTTGTGMVALATAYGEAGDHSNERNWYIRAWRETRLSDALERVILARCSACITKALDKERLDRMAYQGARAELLRAAKRLGSAYVELAEAHIAVDRRSRSANAQYGQVPESLRGDVALSLSRATWLRRANRDEEARRIVLAAPTDRDKILDAEAWWTERRLLARRALGDKDAARDAYRLAAEHGLESGNSYADAEFLAGWIALRYLGDPATARRHFDRLRAAVDQPISVARAEYWLARAYRALGSEDTAREHMAAAARHGITYYGQLARNAIQGDASLLDLPSVSEEQWLAGAAVADDPLMRAAQLLAAAGHRYTASTFLRHLSYRTTEPGALQRIADMANVLAMPQVGVRIGKVGVAAGAPLHQVAYPTADFPRLTPAPAVEQALLLALTRQESEFAWQAASHAGARGLMQVMPATGKMLARRAGVAYSLRRLGEDPEYNASLGALYLGGLIEDFGGSYVLAIAAYNAGPGRVREWIDRFGDPRDSDVDVVDWIEEIPFNETRNYVQRVLENLQVYRARLAAEAAPLRLAADLARGRASGRIANQ